MYHLVQKRLPLVLLIIAIALVMFAYGAFVGHYKVFPYGNIRDGVTTVRPLFRPIMEEYEPSSLVSGIAIESHLYALQQHFVALEKASATGGAIEPLGDTDTLLVVTPRGRIALVHPAGEAVYLREQVPMNQAALEDSALPQTSTVQKSFRVADILLHEQSPDTFTLFVSHHYFTEDCVEFRISSTSLHLDSASAMTFSPWQTLFIADPCLTFTNKRHDPDFAFEGLLSGGRMLMDGNEHLLVVIGTHGWGGRGKWPIVSDGPDAHLSKLLRIHVITGTAESISMYPIHRARWPSFWSGVTNPL